jgi:RNA polymerase sigma-70 factor, ECF subfamily
MRRGFLARDSFRGRVPSSFLGRGRKMPAGTPALPNHATIRQFSRAGVSCFTTRRKRDGPLPEHSLSQDEIRRLYDLHGAALVLYARAFAPDAATAEDIVHGVFVKLLRARPTITGAGPAYLYRAVKNAALNARRDHSREAPLPEQETWLTHRGGDREAAIALQRALAELPLEQRETVIMRIWSGMTLEEIAEAVDVPLGTAASRYRYALAKLRERLKPHAKAGEKGEQHGR